MVAINQIKAVAASLALIAIVAPQQGVDAAPALRANSREAELPNVGRRMERVVVRSTSPPEAVRRAPAPPKKKPAAPAKKAPAPKKPAAKAPAKAGSGSDHTHIHEHIHDHDNDRHRHGRGRGRKDRKDRHGNKYTAKNKANHSKHWAIHHGLNRREEAEPLTERHLIEIGDTYDMSSHKKHGKNDDDLVQVLIGRDGLVERHSRHSGHSDHWYDHHRGDRHDRSRGGNQHVHSHVHEHERRHSSDHSDHWYKHHKGDSRHRTSDKEHVHSHVHEHDRRHSSDHSDHWYEHHNKGGHHHSHGSGSEHLHEHIHEHKRGLDVSREESKLNARSHSRFRYHPRDLLVEERGLLGDVVKPLLAPLNAIPGFITISDLLFSDGGLVKKLGGLVLHATPAATTTDAKSLAVDTTAFNYSLMASKAERTQVWLMATDVNATEEATSEAPAPSAFSNDTTTVRVALPIIDDKGEPVLYCATFDKAPPSSLQLQPCVDDASEASPEAVAAPTSQRFSYTSSTGSLAPIYMAAADASNSTVSSSSTEAVSSTASASSATTSASATGRIAIRGSPASYFRVLQARNDTVTDVASSTAAPSSTQSAADSTSTSAATAAPTATSDANAGKVSLKFTPAGAAPKKLAATAPIADDEDSTPADAAVDSAEEAAETVMDAAPTDALPLDDAAPTDSLPLEAAPTDALPLAAASPVTSALPADDVSDDATEAFTGALDRAAIIDDVSALVPNAADVTDEVNEAVETATSLSQGETPAAPSLEDVEEVAEPVADASAPIAEALNLAAKPSSTSSAAKARDTCTCVPQTL